MRALATSVLTICLLPPVVASADPAAAQVGGPWGAVEPPRAVLISLDGFEARYLDEPGLELPNLRSLARRGVHGASRTILPSVTWPAHTTIITGTLPARHGVVGNHWLDRRAQKVVDAWTPSKADSIDVPTIFDVAKAAGRTTAALSWPQTNGADSLDFEIPEVYSHAAFDKWVTPALRTELRAADIPVDMLHELAKTEDIALDRLISDAAELVIKRHDPGLLLVHFTAGDTRAHQAGVLSPRHREGLEAYDAQVGQILQALDATGRTDSTVIVVVSDHGFFPIKAAVDPAKLAAQGGFSAKDVTFVHNGHLSYGYIRGGKGREERVAGIRRLLTAHPAIEKSYGATELASLGLPTPHANPRVGDLVLIATPDHAFSALVGSAAVGPYPYKATHGYPAEHPSNYPVFIAAGPGVRRQRRPIEVRNVDIAPTLARLIGLDMPTAVDGRLLTHLMLP